MTLLEEKHQKQNILVSFECETLKAEKEAEDHINKFMPKLAGMDAVGELSIFFCRVISVAKVPNTSYNHFSLK